MQRLDNNIFLAVLVIATLALGWIIAPYFGAILWGIIAAILFGPFYGRLLNHMPRHRNLAALITLSLIVAIAVIPAVILGILVVQEVTGLYDKLRAGHIDFMLMFQHIQDMLPKWAVRSLDRIGLMDLDLLRKQVSSELANSVQMIAGQALSIGRAAFNFIVTVGIALYLAFFLMRDGDKLSRILDGAVPLSEHTRHEVAKKFIAVTRATINGSMVVAIVQGMLGGAVFWALGISAPLLWGVVMAFFSLLPAIGTGLVWVPVAIYLLASGAVVKGLILVVCGLFVIGMVDNVLRPILVGRGTRIPDYIVLISTLGGLEIFGFNGIIVGPVIASLFLTVWEIFAVARQMTPEERASRHMIDQF